MGTQCALSCARSRTTAGARRCARAAAAPLPTTTPADIAAVAATALTQEGHAGQTYTLTGDELLTTKQQVEILAGVLNRTIEYVEITPEEAAQDALARGMDQVSVAAIRDITEVARADGMAIITDDVERVTGQKTASFESWCWRNAAAFA